MTTAEESKLVDAKVVLLGALGVGKTSLITRYSQKKFIGTTSPTIGASFTTLRVNVGNAKVRIQLWDTAGQERFRAMAPLYYRKANAAIVAYDITSVSSFEAMKQWVLELRRNVEEAYCPGSECSALSNEGIDEMFRLLALRIIESEEKASASRENHVDPNSIVTDPSLYGSLDTFTLSKTLRIDRLSSTHEDIKSSSSCSC
ncbi:hypothetical protein MRX96_026425 [Rhipicephalus microplus]